jgi:hypothetical protein
MQSNLSFKKRCGEDPHHLPEIIEQGGSVAVDGCPDVWELSNGDFAVIGIRKTKELKDLLPESAGCGTDEEIVLVPRIVMANAKRDLPDYQSK